MKIIEPDADPSSTSKKVFQLSPEELFVAFLREVDSKGSTIESIESGSTVRREMIERSTNDKCLIARMIADHFLALSKEACYEDKMFRHLVFFRRLSNDLKPYSSPPLRRDNYQKCFSLHASLILAELAANLEVLANE